MSVSHSGPSSGLSLDASLSLALVLLVLASACVTEEAPPRLHYGRMESPSMQREMGYAVFAPQDHEPRERLPLVVFLHGGGDGTDCLDKAGAGEVLDAAMDAGRVPRAVVVVPQGDLGFWENWKDGSRLYRDWVVKDLLPEIQRTYGTQPCPLGCHVMGISMGGHGALRFALLEADRFSSVTAISAPIFDTEGMQEIANSFWLKLIVPVERIWGNAEDRAELEAQDLFLVWSVPGGLEGLRLVLAWGDADRSGIQRRNEAFHEKLVANGIPHEAIVFEGGHDWESWVPVLQQVMRIQLGDPDAQRKILGAAAEQR